MGKTKQAKNFYLIGAILLLFTGICLGGYLVLKSKIGQADINETQKEQVTELNKNQDADHDGLFDWQETIFNTDPQNPDTDGDGYLDGEEIISGYDPLVSAPNDQKTDSLVELRESPDTFQTDNLTETLSHLLSSRLIFDNQKGWLAENQLTVSQLPATEPIIEEMLKNLLNLEIIFSKEHIPLSTIKITQDNSPEALRIYFQEANSIIQGNFESMGLEKGAGQRIIEQVIITQNFSQVDQIIAYYQKTFQELKNLFVPSLMTDFHRQELALLLTSQKIFESLQFISTDPLRTLLALSQYRALLGQTNDLQNKVNSFIQEHNL